jgi:4-amino-4-deoxy-L-arabinose transferase-like glycosyltransferase
VPGDWPKAGYRAPLLPYTLAVLYTLIPYQSLIDLFMPFISALSVVLLYLLAKNLFKEETALYSSIFLTFLPLHVLYSGKILTDVFASFFLTLSVLLFWLGFEKGKNIYKLLFGFFLALSLLARYTTLWVLPLFPIYLILKCKNLSFLKDKFL